MHNCESNFTDKKTKCALFQNITGIRIWQIMQINSRVILPNNTQQKEKN